jgi:FeS assembly SUF system protein
VLQRLLNRLYKKNKPEDESTPETEKETPANEPSASIEADALKLLDERDSKPATAPVASTEDGATADPESAPDEDSGEPIDPEAVKEEIIAILKTVYDPEIPLNIYELGLIYDVKVEPSGMTEVIMTLTSPACPAAGILPGEVESKTRSVSGVKDVNLDLTFEPPWTPDKMSEAAKLELGLL